eukprot:5024880-Prymnesium_polylepis.2
MGIKGADIIAKRADMIQNFMYKYLATVDAGVDYESASELGMKANISEVLRCRGAGRPPRVVSRGVPEPRAVGRAGRQSWPESAVEETADGGGRRWAQVQR